MAFDHYPIEKRKKIALWCAVGFGILLIGVLIVVYSHPQVREENSFSVMIASGYTTIVESALVFFTKK